MKKKRGQKKNHREKKPNRSEGGKKEISNREKNGKGWEERKSADVTGVRQ